MSKKYLCRCFGDDKNIRICDWKHPELYPIKIAVNMRDYVLSGYGCEFCHTEYIFNQESMSYNISFEDFEKEVSGVKNGN